MQTLTQDEIRQTVRENYGQIAISNGTESCCGSSCCGDDSATKEQTKASTLGYSSANTLLIPEAADMSLGCGNPQAIAALKPGETVLDLGSGGGFDCFLAAQQVGETGQVIGVDMTPEMINTARNNAAKSNINHVEFRLGEIEQLPVAEQSVDVIISNCVINLSPDKPRVFQEAYRTLKPGGRLAISDIVATAPLPDNVRQDWGLYTGCMAGAAQVEELEKMLTDSGFVKVQIAPKNESKSFIQEWLPEGKLEDYLVSATIEAVRPM